MLPIFSALPDLTQALSQRDEVVLEAPPGAGKTTQVPLSLLEAPWLGKQKILMLVPRRIAARSAAERMASVLNENVGETVGYRIRLETRVSAQTRIEIVTEGILQRMLQSDPSLEGYGILIFDEFHERSLDADLGLALTLEAREYFREESALKILVMSATLDDQSISALLNDAPTIISSGKAYPVKTFYCGEPNQNEWLEQKMLKTIQLALAEQTGSILCFLPGIKQIKNLEQLLSESLNEKNVNVAPLYGELSLQQQRQAIEPAPQGKRKVVLATNIAETSLTIEGVNIVIDSGLCRRAKFDPKSAMTRLHTQKISRASATQRSGRAGRLAPGVCYRLWSEGQQEQLKAFDEAEITQADLTVLALQLASWGTTDPNELNWLDTPPKGAFKQACSLLMQLGALTEQGQITQHGQLMAKLPAHPRLAHMLIQADSIHLGQQACQIAALLMEKDPLANSGADLNSRLDWLRQEQHKGANKGLWQRLKKQEQQYAQMLQRLATAKNAKTFSIAATEQAGLLLAFAYPDRIAQQRRSKSIYKLNNGRAAHFYAQDSLNKQNWLSIASVQGQSQQANDIIGLAAPLNPSLIEQYQPQLISQKESVEWDEQEGRIKAQKQTFIGTLIWQSTTSANPSKEAIQSALITQIKRQGLDILPWSDELRAWQQRVVFAKQVKAGNEEWPDLSDKWLSAHMDEWLSPYLTNISQPKQLKGLDLTQILKTLLTWPLPQQLDQLVPERFKVPSGSNIRIDYSQNPPILAVKLQEMFGCTSTPKVANHVALQLHLLSPAQRPLQVTQDLESFWVNAYKDVQKDMKGRYPKHPWPDNPLEALPTAKTKRALERKG